MTTGTSLRDGSVSQQFANMARAHAKEQMLLKLSSVCVTLSTVWFILHVLFMH